MCALVLRVFSLSLSLSFSLSFSFSLYLSFSRYTAGVDRTLLVGSCFVLVAMCSWQNMLHSCVGYLLCLFVVVRRFVICVVARGLSLLLSCTGAWAMCAVL